MSVNDMPSGRGYGESLKKYFTIDDGIHVIGMVDSKNTNHTLLSTESGYGFICDNHDLGVFKEKGQSYLKEQSINAFKTCCF